MEAEEEYARRLLGPLAGEITERSTVDLDRAILVGGRRRLGHRIATGTALAVVTAAVVAVVPMVVNRGSRGVLPEPGGSNSATPTASLSPTPFQRPPTPALPTICTVKLLPTPKGTLLSTVSGGDSTGRYAIGRARAKGSGFKVTPLIWDSERMAVVPLPGSDVTLQSVNSHGTAVGNSLVNGRHVAWIYENGVMRELPSNGMATATSSINDNGVIVGVAYGPRDHVLPGKSTPVVWRSSTSSPVALPLPAGVESGGAADVDSDGTIVGGFMDADHKPVAYVWPPDGAGYPLVKPRIDGKLPAGSGVESIRDGWVVGMVEGIKGDSTRGYWVARWDLRTGRSLAFGALPTGANDVNRVGMFAATDGQGHAVLSNGEKTITLPEIFPRTLIKDNLANIPRGVSDDGRIIVGQATDTEGNVQAVIWHCQ